MPSSTLSDLMAACASDASTVATDWAAVVSASEDKADEKTAWNDAKASLQAAEDAWNANKNLTTAQALADAVAAEQAAATDYVNASDVYDAAMATYVAAVAQMMTDQAALLSYLTANPPGPPG